MLSQTPGALGLALLRSPFSRKSNLPVPLGPVPQGWRPLPPSLQAQPLQCWWPVLPIHTSPNCPLPSFLMSCRDSRGISQTSLVLTDRSASLGIPLWHGTAKRQQSPAALSCRRVREKSGRGGGVPQEKERERERELNENSRHRTRYTLVTTTKKIIIDLCRKSF